MPMRRIPGQQLHLNLYLILPPTKETNKGASEVFWSCRTLALKKLS